MITAAQIRAARGLLKWTQGSLAAKSGLSIVTLNMIESEAVHPRKSTLAAIRQALESGGVEFIGGGGGVGVRFKGQSPGEPSITGGGGGPNRAGIKDI